MRRGKMKGEREDGEKEFGRGTRRGHVIRMAVLLLKADDLRVGSSKKKLK